MKLLLFLCLFACALQATTPARVVANVESSILSDDESMSQIKSVMNNGMNRALQRAIDELNSRGETALASQINSEWVSKFGGSLFSSDRDIGDHKGISQWINDTYRKIEFVLGRDFCVNTHIAALLTFNSANVVVKPCSFPMDSVSGTRIDEYRRHFAGKSANSDSRYNGVIPEATFFACEIACLTGTAGAGSVLCGIAASIGEKIMAMFVAPPLSDKIFKRACGG